MLESETNDADVLICCVGFCDRHAERSDWFRSIELLGCVFRVIRLYHEKWTRKRNYEK